MDYFSWDDDDAYAGLARNQGQEWAVVAQTQKAWALKPELFGVRLGGDTVFTEIDRSTAASLAERYGVALDAPATLRWDAATGEFVPL